jgi:hypothetical protein
MRWSADELLYHDYFRENMPFGDNDGRGGGHLPVLTERRRQSLVAQNSIETSEGIKTKTHYLPSINL